MVLSSPWKRKLSCEKKRKLFRFWQLKKVPTWAMVFSLIYLIHSEGSRVLQIQGLWVRWWVSGCHGKAAQGVTTWTPFSYCAQELFPKVRSQGYPRPTTNSDPKTTLQNALWCPLWLAHRREERDHIEESWGKRGWLSCFKKNPYYPILLSIYLCIYFTFFLTVIDIGLDKSNNLDNWSLCQNSAWVKKIIEIIETKKENRP